MQSRQYPGFETDQPEFDALWNQIATDGCANGAAEVINRTSGHITDRYDNILG